MRVYAYEYVDVYVDADDDMYVDVYEYVNDDMDVDVYELCIVCSAGLSSPDFAGSGHALPLPLTRYSRGAT